MTVACQVSFVGLGVLSLVFAGVFMLVGVSGILTTAMASCGGTAFAYVWHRRRPALINPKT